MTSNTYKLARALTSVLAAFVLVFAPFSAALAQEQGTAPATPDTSASSTASDDGMSIDNTVVDETSATDAEVLDQQDDASNEETVQAPEMMMSSVEIKPTLVTDPNVDSESEMNAALADSSISTITLVGSFTVTAPITVNRTVTIEGGNYTITGGFTRTSGSDSTVVVITGSNVIVNNLTVDGGAATQNLHAIQAYATTDVTLNSVTAQNSRTGVLVNGSSVTVNNLTTTGNVWHGVNVDQGSGVTSPASLTVNGTHNHSGSVPAIWVDNTTKNVSVSGNTEQYTTQDKFVGRAYYRTTAPVPVCESGDATFDSFNLGSVNGQNGWSATGPYDQEIVTNYYGFADLGCKLLRVSDAITSGSFGDWIFAAPIADSVGESAATAGSYSEGTRRSTFDMSFDLASTRSTEQPGLAVSVSPDRGDGSRMSFLRFEDRADGIHVVFSDVVSDGTSAGTTFRTTEIPSVVLSRTESHNVRLTLETVEGPSNDVVTVYINGSPVHTGNSWEDYYRYSAEAAAEQSPRIVKTMIIQARGTAHPANDEYGYLFDNVSLSAGPVTAVVDEDGDEDEDESRSNRRGGGRSGGSDNDDDDDGQVLGAATTTVSTGGQVLGASTYNFMVDLTIGSTGADVTELQSRLIAGGYLMIAAPTGYFGELTRAALAKWQAANGIAPAVGYFGPLSRGKMNGGSAPTSIQAQLEALQAQLAALIAARDAANASSTESN